MVACLRLLKLTRYSALCGLGAAVAEARVASGQELLGILKFTCCDLVITREFMSHGHPLLHVHARCLVVCLVHAVLALCLLLVVLHVCLLCALGLMLMLLRLHAG